MRLLDLFCGAGGAARGYHLAGFHVTGIDHVPQPRYAGDVFIQGDALAPPVRLEDFDVIHASPPCQAHTAMKTMANARQHQDLIPQTRRLLVESGRPYVIENVEGAPLVNPIRVCGAGLGLGAWSIGYELRRHRLFESNIGQWGGACAHYGPVIGIYGDHARARRHGLDFPDKDKVRLASEAMGIDWMNWRELTQAIPPAYTEFVGNQLMDVLTRSPA